MDSSSVEKVWRGVSFWRFPIPAPPDRSLIDLNTLIRDSLIRAYATGPQDFVFLLKVEETTVSGIDAWIFHVVSHKAAFVDTLERLRQALVQKCRTGAGASTAQDQSHRVVDMLEGGQALTAWQEDQLHSVENTSL
jgi:hypothetical protein